MHRHVPIIAANWKMNKTISEAVDFVEGLKKEDASFGERIVIVAPPFTALGPVSEILKNSPIKLAAQNIAWAEAGAFTGEVSAGMLTDAGCDYVIIGHSERRSLFAETDELINQKMHQALNASLKPIFCVGETLEERESGSTLKTIERQLREGLINVSAGDIQRIVFAYEPVWAIGTGKTASPEQAVEVHRFIKEIARSLMGEQRDEWTIPVIYGGSVNEKTIGDLMSREDIDGALVGGASLNLESFLKIIRFDITE